MAQIWDGFSWSQLAQWPLLNLNLFGAEAQSLEIWEVARTPVTFATLCKMIFSGNRCVGQWLGDSLFRLLE